jgi:hypothetical protein
METLPNNIYTLQNLRLYMHSENEFFLLLIFIRTFWQIRPRDHIDIVLCFIDLQKKHFYALKRIILDSIKFYLLKIYGNLLKSGL